MAEGISTNNVAHAWLNWLRGVAPTPPAGLYVQLHTGAPGSTGGANIVAGDTTRKPVSMAAAAGGQIILTGTNPVWTNAGTSETITHITVWSAATAGTFLWSAQLSASQPWVATNTFTLVGLTVAISPLAS